MLTLLATSLFHFQVNKLLKNMVCILALFGLSTVLATFQKILGDFFQIIWSPWLQHFTLKLLINPQSWKHFT
jgi:hypothetical protein